MAKVRLQGSKEKEQGIYYEVDTSDAPIGEGGMGKVYAGTSVDTSTGVTRPVAIKFMFMDVPDQAIERARREAGVHLRNDNVVEMLGFIETEEKRSDGSTALHYHVVSELLNGVSLSDLLDGNCNDRNGNEIPYARKLLNDFSKDPDNFAKTVIKAVLSGIMALHDAGYIHRDIDPSNIMITDDGKIKLIDFGICKRIDNLTTNDKPLTVANTFMGKPEYAAPELCLGDLQHHNQTTDIYSIGMMLFQCIVGHVPFQGSRYQIIENQIKEKVPLKLIQNKQLRDIIAKACEKKQELRYQTAAEMRVDLESIDVKRALDPKKKRLIIMGSVIIALCIAGGILGIVGYHHHAENEKKAMMERQQIDSLTNVINRSLNMGRNLAAEGYRHDENFDESLVKAMQAFNRVDSAVQLLPKDAKSNIPDYSADVKQLQQALNSAYNELTEKVKVIEAIPDPEVAAEVGGIKARIENIKNVTTIKDVATN